TSRFVPSPGGGSLRYRLWDQFRARNGARDRVGGGTVGSQAAPLETVGRGHRREGFLQLERDIRRGTSSLRRDNAKGDRHRRRVSEYFFDGFACLPLRAPTEASPHSDLRSH